MPGLFDLDDDTKLGLLTAALAAMSARGVRPGTALAQGGLLGLGAMQNARAGRADAARQAREDEFRQMQMDDYRRKIAEQQERQQGILSAYRGAVTPEQPAVEFGGGEGTRPGVPASFDPQKFALALGNVDPLAAAQMLAPKAQDSPYAKINPKDYTLESLRVFSKTKDPSVLVPREEQKAPDNPLGKVGPSDFTPASVQAFIAGGGKDYSVLQPIDKRPIGPTIHNYPDLPKDHMWTDPRDPRKGVTMIPGSETERAAAARKAAEQASGNIVLTNISRARSMVQNSPVPLTGMVGSQVARVPGTPQYNLSQIIAPIKANIRLDALTQMRSLSKTGAALGNVTEKEGEVMERKVASLEQAQTAEQFLQALDDVEREYNRIVNGVTSAPAAGNSPKRIKFSDLPR